MQFYSISASNSCFTAEVKKKKLTVHKREWKSCEDVMMMTQTEKLIAQHSNKRSLCDIFIH